MLGIRFLIALSIFALHTTASQAVDLIGNVLVLDASSCSTNHEAVFSDPKPVGEVALVVQAHSGPMPSTRNLMEALSATNYELNWIIVEYTISVDDAELLELIEMEIHELVSTYLPEARASILRFSEGFPLESEDCTISREDFFSVTTLGSGQ